MLITLTNRCYSRIIKDFYIPTIPPKESNLGEIHVVFFTVFFLTKCRLICADVISQIFHPLLFEQCALTAPSTCMKTSSTFDISISEQIYVLCVSMLSSNSLHQCECIYQVDGGRHTKKIYKGEKKTKRGKKMQEGRKQAGGMESNV